MIGKSVAARFTLWLLLALLGGERGGVAPANCPSLETCVTWSPDGALLASASRREDDRWPFTIKIWQASTGERLRTLTGRSSVIYSVAWSPDGCRLASGSQDGTLRVWGSNNTER